MSETETKNFLTSTNEDEVLRHLHGVLGDAIAALEGSDATKLYQDVHKSFDKEKFKETIESWPEEKIAEFAKLRLIRSLLTTVSAIIADRNQKDSKENNSYHIETMIETARAAGYTDQDLENFFSSIKIWKTLTPHPTEHLNALGIRLFRRLIEIGDVSEEKQAEILQETIRKFLFSDISPSRRATTFEETDAAMEQLAINRAGQRAVFRRVNEAVNTVYRDYISPPDLHRDEVKIDLGMRIWHGGGDTDGKVNADRWALLYGMVAVTRTAVQEHLNDVLKAKELVEQGSDGSIKGDWDQVSGKFYNVETALKTLLQRLDAIEGRFVYTNDEKFKSLKEDVDFEVIKEEFSQLYEGLSFGSLKIQTPQDFVRQLEKHLKNLSRPDNVGNKEAREIMAESRFMLRQYGLAAAKIEVRHNGHVYKKIMGNLFSDQQVRQILDVAWVGTFADQSANVQIDLIKNLNQKLSSSELREALLRSNPEVKDENGYVVQTHEILRRFDLMALYEHKFGMAIISDADPMSASYQQFITQSFGLKKLLHTPLNEDYETLRNLGANLAAYHEGVGKEAMLARMIESADRADQHVSQAQMIPCSDSLKLLGRLVTWLQAEGLRETVSQSVAMKIATLIKWGNGLSIERGGDDPMVYTRIVAQALQEYVHERGKPLNPKNTEDRILLQMATFFSNTEQGRSQRIYSATPQQAARELCDQLGEMLGRRLELEGRIATSSNDNVLFIPPRDKLSKRMHQFLNDTAYEMMERYQAFREAKGLEGEDAVLDTWAATVSDSKMAGFANNSARAQSKTEGNKASKLAQQRAIGSNIWIALARTHHDGYFTAGEFMERIHQEYRAGRLSKNDIKQFMYDSDWWRRNYFLRSLTAVVSSDMAHGFERMGKGKEWSFDRAIKIGGSVEVKDGRLIYDDPDESHTTPAEVLQAAFFEDQALFVALTEAALGIDEGLFYKSKEELLESIKPKDDSIGVIFGAKTLDRWGQLKKLLGRRRDAEIEHALVDICEAQAENLSESLKRMVMSGWRAATHPDMRMILGKTSYGRRQIPAWKDIIFWNQNLAQSSAPELSN